MFAVVGIASARRVSSALRDMNDEHGAAGRQLRRQIVGTAAVVFVTFLLRAVFSTMNNLAAEPKCRAPANGLFDCCSCSANRPSHSLDSLAFWTPCVTEGIRYYISDFPRDRQ